MNLKAFDGSEHLILDADCSRQRHFLHMLPTNRGDPGKYHFDLHPKLLAHVASQSWLFGGFRDDRYRRFLIKGFYEQIKEYIDWHNPATKKSLEQALADETAPFRNGGCHESTDPAEIERNRKEHEEGKSKRALARALSRAVERTKANGKS